GYDQLSVRREITGADEVVVPQDWRKGFACGRIPQTHKGIVPGRCGHDLAIGRDGEGLYTTIMPRPRVELRARSHVPEVDLNGSRTGHDLSVGGECKLAGLPLGQSAPFLLRDDVPEDKVLV